MAYQTRTVDLELLEREKAALFASQVACEERDALNRARRPLPKPSIWERFKEWFA